MSDEDNEDSVLVEISGTVRFYKTVRVSQELANQLVNARGFDLRNLVDREIVIEAPDIVELEDVEDCVILDESVPEEEE